MSRVSLLSTHKEGRSFRESVISAYCGETKTDYSVRGTFCSAFYVFSCFFGRGPVISEEQINTEKYNTVSVLLPETKEPWVVIGLKMESDEILPYDFLLFLVLNVTLIHYRHKQKVLLECVQILSCRKVVCHNHRISP